jgi:GNAT superfamily N-acetyltransferase
MARPTHPPAEIRRLWRADVPLFRDHLLRLDPRGRHERFGGGMSDDFLLRYVASAFGAGDLFFGAFVDRELRGVAELRSSAPISFTRPPLERYVRAEAAFSVEAPYRRKGIGEMLFARIERAASNHGVETIDIVCSPDNAVMMALARKFKMRLAFEEGEIAGQLAARPPDAGSLMREAARDAMDFSTALIGALRRAVAKRPSEKA